MALTTAQGALVVRFMMEDSSLCFVNCHLAAGQAGTARRNADVASILEAALFPGLEGRRGAFVGGGNGSMVMDHELCILHGDLNYRLDYMSRDMVVQAIDAKKYAKLLERDQLSVLRHKNPSFHLGAFTEESIQFAPTYKYDRGTDEYDSSEKRRVPAWCDRILHRGGERIQQTSYERHELSASDHRPVSGAFKLRIKTARVQERCACLQRSEQRFLEVHQRVSHDAKYVSCLWHCL